jgi:glucose/arabinose dehydrogenase
MRRRLVAGVCVLATLLFMVLPASAQLATRTVITGLEGIVAFVQDPVVPDTFYVVQLSGTVRVLQGGTLLPTPFLDLTGVVKPGGELGLLGFVFSPDTASGRVFVNFTDVNGDTVVARFTRPADNPLVANPASRLDLQWPDGQLVIKQPGKNHKGGHLAFGPDGYLYIGLGDGLDPYDPLNNAQNPATLLGKMLRIDVNVPDADLKGYSVPPTNPFVGQAVLPEIWAFGLRNPWRYSFDNVSLGGTGALIIGDVGQQTREEVDYEPAGRGGRNYGWRMREGTVPAPGAPPTPPAFLPLTEPLFDYPRTLGRAVTGGYVYRGSALPAAFKGRYFVGDFIRGFVASVGLAVNPTTGEATVIDAQLHTTELGGEALGLIVSFAEDLAGELYIIQMGTIYKIVPDAGVLPDVPTGLVSEVTGSTVKLTWQPVQTGQTPHAYRLEVGSSPGASDLFVGDMPSDPTEIVTGGVPNGHYFARVRAVGSTGAGPASAETELTVGCTAPPATPPVVSHVVVGNVVAVAWNVVPDATSYVLEAGSASGLSDLAVVPLPERPAGIVTPAPTGTYFVRVRTQNACGTSGVSNQVVVVVP